jgi:hypothetical protein
MPVFEGTTGAQAPIDSKPPLVAQSLDNQRRAVAEVEVLVSALQRIVDRVVGREQTIEWEALEQQKLK